MLLYDSHLEVRKVNVKTSLWMRWYSFGYIQIVFDLSFAVSFFSCDLCVLNLIAFMIVPHSSRFYTTFLKNFLLVR